MSGSLLPILAAGAATFATLVLALVGRLGKKAAVRRATRVRPGPALTRWTDLELRRRARVHRDPRRARRHRRA